MTPSLINWRSRPNATANVALIACGALGPTISALVASRHWEVDVHLLPALLHNRPRLIAPKVECLIRELQGRGQRVAVAYADCGTYGALDDVCERLGVERLHGQHCYDVFATPRTVEHLFAEEPGTYLLTDFLARSFRRTVVAELGLDRYPQLWDDYFRNYRRIVWLAQQRTPELEREVRSLAERFTLPLEIVDVGTLSFEIELASLLDAVDLDIRLSAASELK